MRDEGRHRPGRRLRHAEGQPMTEQQMRAGRRWAFDIDTMPKK